MGSDSPFNNREIREMFSDMKEGLARVEAQTTRTNGRVLRIELIVAAVVALLVGLGFKEVLAVLSIL